MEVITYELPNYAYNKLKQLTGWNISKEEAEREIARMTMLGLPVHKDSTHRQVMYLFDDLRIRINTTFDGRQMVTGIWQLKIPIHGWGLDKRMYAKIGKKLGLKSRL